MLRITWHHRLQKRARYEHEDRTLRQSGNPCTRTPAEVCFRKSTLSTGNILTVHIISKTQDYDDVKITNISLTYSAGQLGSGKNFSLKRGVFSWQECPLLQRPRSLQVEHDARLGREIRVVPELLDVAVLVGRVIEEGSLERLSFPAGLELRQRKAINKVNRMIYAVEIPLLLLGYFCRASSQETSRQKQ